jgi:putative flippase GtrA
MEAEARLPRQLLLFAGAGAVGFTIEAVVITILVVLLDTNIYLARLISFTLAVLATWRLNRQFAFSGSASADRAREYGRYFLVQTCGAAVNLGVFAVLVTLYQDLREWPVIPLAAGAAVALLFNFVVSRAFVFVGRGQSGPGQ